MCVGDSECESVYMHGISACVRICLRLRTDVHARIRIHFFIINFKVIIKNISFRQNRSISYDFLLIFSPAMLPYTTRSTDTAIIKDGEKSLM